MSVVEGWKTTSLPLLLRLMKSGGTPDTSRSDYYGGDVPFVTIEDMTASRRHLSCTIKTLTDEGLKNSNAWVVPANSILYSIYATLGLPRINIVPVTTNQAILALINDPNKIDPNYLYYWFEYIRPSVVNFSSQTTQSNLNATIVKTFLVDHPTDLSDQSKIAEVLSTVDQAIDQTEALIAKQQRIKTGLMQDLLTRGIDEHGNLRSENTHKFKDSPLGRIPVEWEVVTLSYFIKKLEAGISVNSDDKPCGSGQIGVLKTSALNKGDFLPEQNKTVLCIEENRARVSPTANTILISRMNTPDLVGESGFVDTDYPHLFLPDRIWMTIFHVGKEKAARWLSFVMTSPDARGYITLNATGTSGSMKNLPKYSLFKMPLRTPTNPEEQQKIAHLLECQNIQIGQMKRSLEKIRSLKTALMQDLLTGKKRVTALLNDMEVAGV